MLFSIPVFFFALIGSAAADLNNIEQLPVLNTSHAASASPSQASGDKVHIELNQTESVVEKTLSADQNQSVPVAAHTTAGPTVTTHVTTDIKTVVHRGHILEVPTKESLFGNTNKLSDYIKPICEASDKLTPKQLDRVHGQLKSFIQLVSN